MLRGSTRFFPQLIAAACLCAVITISGCAKKISRLKSPADGTNSGREFAGGSIYDEDGNLIDPSVDVEEGDIRSADFTDIPDLGMITFDYDRYTLTPEARSTLKTNSAYLKSHQDLKILVEGHCDNRGTLAYNLALGQKRAKNVREYYIRLGVDGKTIGTISFGEEKPLCGEENDDCWLRNRRAATLVGKERDGGDRSILPENAASESRETR